SRAVRRLVPLRHLAEAEGLAAVLGEAEADEPTRLLRHEVHRFGRGELGRNRQVTLVLAVGRVDDHDELALADVLDRVLDGGEGGFFLDFHSKDGSPGRSRSTYFARTSGSRFTCSPKSFARLRVSTITSNARVPFRASVTVRQTPSTATESPISASILLSTIRRPPAKEATRPRSWTIPVNTQ